MRAKTKRILKLYGALVLLFFYVPIIVLMVFSFNNSDIGTVWTGFTFEWYQSLFSNAQIVNAAKNSLIIAVITTIVSVILGTLAALAIHRYIFPGRGATEFLIYIPIIIPTIVIGVALLAIYGFLKIKLGLFTAVPGHVIIATSYVALVILARLAGLNKALEEAAKDLGANEWSTFWKITFPLIFPGILAGALLAFTISLDEFVISFFTTGPGYDTLPVLVYSMVRHGVSPEINALSTVLILFIMLIVFIVGLRIMRQQKS